MATIQRTRQCPFDENLDLVITDNSGLATIDLSNEDSVPADIPPPPPAEEPPPETNQTVFVGFTGATNNLFDNNTNVIREIKIVNYPIGVRSVSYQFNYIDNNNLVETIQPSSEGIVYSSTVGGFGQNFLFKNTDLNKEIKITCKMYNDRMAFPDKFVGEISKNFTLFNSDSTTNTPPPPPPSDVSEQEREDCYSRTRIRNGRREPFPNSYYINNELMTLDRYPASATSVVYEVFEEEGSMVNKKSTKGDLVVRKTSSEPNLIFGVSFDLPNRVMNKKLKFIATIKKGTIVICKTDIILTAKNSN